MSQANSGKKPAPARSFAFGAITKPRKKAAAAQGTLSDQELIARFHSSGGKVTVCPPRYADGAVETSGDYSWG